MSNTRKLESVAFFPFSNIRACTKTLLCMGYSVNQEDSVIINANSIARGLFNLTTFRTVEESEKKRDAYNSELICVPPLTTSNIKQGEPGYFRRKNANYNFLDEHGVIRSRVPYQKRCGECTFGWYEASLGNCPSCGKPGMYRRGGGSIAVRKGDVLVGKILTTTDKAGVESKMDMSRIVQEGEEGEIDRVYIHTTPSGHRIIKVIIRKTRPLIRGDKVCSEQAQKGTIGGILPEIDMPFSKETGAPVDLIINPHCLPSRMTINLQLECLNSKGCCLAGKYGDATPFTTTSIGAASNIIKEFGELLENNKFNRFGWETLCNGYTGEEMKSKIFVATDYYQRLKHNVSDKMHARATGDVTGLTRQAPEGRSNLGGLRIGDTTMLQGA